MSEIKQEKWPGEGTQVTLPDTLKGWTSAVIQYEGWTFWEHVRPFFNQHGYDLYVPEPSRPHSFLLVPRESLGLVPDSFGVYGSRHFAPSFRSLYAVVWAARDRQHRDVIIKVVGREIEGANEIDILQFLSSEPLKSDPENGAVPLVELLHYDVWTFAVFQRWGAAMHPEMDKVVEALDFCSQVSQTVAFFHRNLIAHLDIAHENILINFLGIEQINKDSKYLPFRELFPVRYAFIDFGISCRFLPESPPESRLAEVYRGRPHRAPELEERKPYDPFAADVYQTGTMFYQWFYDVVPRVPGLLAVLRDMTKREPSLRISMQEAHDRLRRVLDEFQGGQEVGLRFSIEWDKVVPQEPEIAPESQPV